MSVLSPTIAAATATPIYPDGLAACPGTGSADTGLVPALTPILTSPTWLGRLAHEAETVPVPVDIGVIVGAVALAAIIAWRLVHHHPPKTTQPKTTQPKTTQPKTTQPRRGPKGRYLKKGAQA